MLQRMPGWLGKYTIKSWANLTMKWDSQIITYYMFVTMLPATKSESIPTSSSSCYPPNATSIMQPLDQGIILSAKRRYKKKLAERYLSCVENNKDANSLLKALDIVQATNMIAASWRETSSTITQKCFRKAGFKHHAVDPAPPEEEPLPAPAPDVWNRVQRW